MALNSNHESWFRKHWLAAALALLLGVVLLGSFVSRHDDAIPIRGAQVMCTNIRGVISTNGKVEPVENFEAHAPVATTVKRLLVREGDRVKRGQLLLELDDADARSQAARAQALLKGAQADVNAVERGGTQEEVLTLDAQLVKARAERDTAQRNLEALRSLQQKGAASVGEVKDAENSLRRAQADLKLLEEKRKDRYSKPEVAKVEAQKGEAQAAYDAAEDILRKSNVRAPFDGTVYSLPVKQGAFVQTGDLLLQEADLSKVLVRAFVDEPDLGRLAAGQRVEVTWDAVPGRVWQGTINSVPSTVKLRGTRNVGETASTVENSDLKLLPNINVGVTIVVSEHRNVLAAPREAVRMDDSTPYVLQVVDNELRRRNVQTGVSDLTQVEISDGLADKALVALSALNNKPLHDRAPVKCVIGCP
jgi:HlyD family secretion protein